MSEGTSAVPRVCHACGYAVQSPVTVWMGGRCYHQGCAPRHWSSGCPIGIDKCAHQEGGHP